MKVIRERPEDNFTQVTNDVMRDERIDDMARGVLCKMLSHADGWSTTADALWKQAAAARPWVRNGAGRRAYRSVFRQLEAAGYLQREKLRHKDGRFETVLILRSRPAHWDSVGPLTESDDPPATGVPEPAPRDRDTGNGRSVSGTSIRTLEPQTLSSGSGELGLPTGPRSKQRGRAADTADKIIRDVRAAIVAWYGEGENRLLEDHEALGLWEALRPQDGRTVMSRTAYLTRIFEDTPNIDTLLSKYVDPDEQHG